MPSRAKLPSMRGSDGVSLRRPTLSRSGREKNPSVSTADVPSDTSRVLTPAHATVTGDCGVADGTSKNRA